MYPENDLKVLEQCSVLRRLAPTERMRIAAAMVPREVSASAVLWRMGEVAAERGLCVIVSGEVSVASRGRRSNISASRTLGPGAVFGEGTLLTDGASPIGARAVSPSRILLLTRERFEALAIDIPALRVVLEDLGTLRAIESDVVAAMRRSALAKHFSARSLAEMCDVAELVRVDGGEVVLRQGDPSPGFFFVIAGQLKVTVQHEGSARPPTLVDTLHPGDVFGDVALVTGAPQPSSVIAWGATTLARVNVAQYRTMLDASQTHRRGIRLPGSDSGDTSEPSAVDVAPRRGETLLMLSSARAPVHTVARLVATALAKDHHDHVLVVGFPRPGASTRAAPTQIDGSVARTELVTDDAHAAASLSELLERVAIRFDYVILDTTDRGDAFLAAIEHRVDRVVHLTYDTYAPLPTRAVAQCPVLHAVLLGAPLRRHDVTTMPMMHSGTVRLRLDVDRLARRRDVTLDELLVHERESVRRLARAVSHRRVGVALGGGGSWGYAHVTLLRAMRNANVPIDIVSGCSFGALVGAYWCALGEVGVERLLLRGGAIRNAVLASLVSSRAIASLVAHDLGNVRLEELDVPFFPVATDVATGTQRAIKSGLVSRGVRASGSFPGIFSPVSSRGARLVDGGIINNVPEDVLVTEGADLVVASNVVSQPAVMRRVPQPLFGGEAGRVMHELNPLGRISDLVRSTLILMHSAGGRDAHLADVTYNAEPIEHLPWDFSVGHIIASHATPEVERVMVDIRSAWQRLAQPSVKRDTLVDDGTLTMENA